jgi:VWFA-related protein
MHARRTFEYALAAALILCVPIPRLPAQASPSTSAPPPDLYTLHVYANLAQVPTLVINPDGRPFPQLTRDQFFVSLDGGTLFHPSQLRIEGDDAISLAIIIDDSGSQSHFITNIAETLSRLAPKDLHAKDHVSIYAIDCKAIQSVNDLPASPDVIRDGVISALSAETLHGDKHKPGCAKSLHLWDVLAHAVDKLSETPSRRVVLFVSLGMDTGSTISFDDVAHLAQANSTAVFGMRDIEEFAFQRTFRDETASGLNGERSRTHVSDRLGRLAALTGGMVFDDQHFQIEDQLHRFIVMLRGRYIVEFPRPDNGIPGSHMIAISIPSKWNYFIRWTGAGIPLADPSVLSDPNTVPSAPSPATFGNQRPAQPKH